MGEEMASSRIADEVKLRQYLAASTAARLHTACLLALHQHVLKLSRKLSGITHRLVEQAGKKDADNSAAEEAVPAIQQVLDQHRAEWAKFVEEQAGDAAEVIFDPRFKFDLWLRQEAACALDLP